MQTPTQAPHSNSPSKRVKAAENALGIAIQHLISCQKHVLPHVSQHPTVAIVNLEGQAADTASSTELAPEMMYEEGSLDVGCGIFGYKVTKHEEITELKEFKQFCYKKDDFEPLAKAGVNKDAIREYTGIPCTGVARPQQVIKKDDKSTFIHWRTSENKVPYQYSIWWKDGCVLADDGPTAAYASNPLMLEKPGHTLCFDNLYRNWKDCNNGGVGGNIQIGCLVYEFKADKNERTW